MACFTTCACSCGVGRPPRPPGSGATAPVEALDPESRATFSFPAATGALAAPPAAVAAPLPENEDPLLLWLALAAPVHDGQHRAGTDHEQHR